MLQTQGVAYAAIIVKDMQGSLDFYQRLGLRLLYLEPNRDDPESVVAVLGADGGAMLQLVGPTHAGVNIAEATLGVGSMQYVAMQVTRAQMQGMFHEMSRAGVHGSEEILRGYERMVFLEDPNGVLVTLVAWETEPPPGLPRAAVLERAGQIRDAAGAPFVEDEHVRRAIAELQATA
jgi:catechol 2,3-dioxygenase-like lactoylglutathione lyase family enzyme